MESIIYTDKILFTEILNRSKINIFIMPSIFSFSRIYKNKRNIFKNENSVVIGDLGLARNKDNIKTASKTAGTCNYMSPETHKDQIVEMASDIWYFEIKLKNFIL